MKKFSLLAAILLCLVFTLPARGQNNKVAKRNFTKQPSGQVAFREQNADTLQLRMVRGTYAVFLYDGTREVVQAGDRLGKEGYLVLGIENRTVLFQTREGFGWVKQTEDGATTLQIFSRAYLPPEYLELAEKAKPQ